MALSDWTVWWSRDPADHLSKRRRFTWLVRAEKDGRRITVGQLYVRRSYPSGPFVYTFGQERPGEPTKWAELEQGTRFEEACQHVYQDFTSFVGEWERWMRETLPFPSTL